MQYRGKLVYVQGMGVKNLWAESLWTVSALLFFSTRKDHWRQKAVKNPMPLPRTGSPVPSRNKLMMSNYKNQIPDPRFKPGLLRHNDIALPLHHQPLRCSNKSYILHARC